MKKISLLFSLLVAAATAIAQPSPVVWKIDAEAASEDNIYDVRIVADIESGWHIYDLGPYDNGVNATVIEFAELPSFRLLGPLEADKAPHRAYDDIFEDTIGTWEGRVVFTQRVELLETSATVQAEVNFSVCNDESCMPPADESLNVTIGDRPVLSDASTETAAPADEPSQAASGRSLWRDLLAAAGWALAALLTPCVFPMIPMTVSFFVKGSEGGRFKALLYGIFIVALYTLPIAALILITRIVGGETVTADIFNWLATHWLPNLIFFAVFMIFAASFFGAFEITLPNSWVNSSDRNADRKGLLGVFFLALTLVLVSFSCTGPIVSGAVIAAVSNTDNIWSPILTMLVFSIVFALPFVLFALFPSMLQKLPKSGGWLNSVKVVLGFIEVALGFKFLSVADQTYHWGLLDREIYLAIWIVVFSMLGFYLLGKLKFAHDSDLKHVTVPRLALAICVFTFVAYMIPGMWGAPLKALSGYLPPIESQDFVIRSGVAVAAPAPTGDKAPKYSDILHLPHQLNGYFDYDEALEASRRDGKPIFLDFTGRGCVSCREMEERVWSDERVLNRLRNDFVILALYGDDRTQVPESEWVTTAKGKVLKTIGAINSNLAYERYGVVAQPYYIVIDTDGNALSTHSYDLSVEKFIEFLDKGKNRFEAE